MRSGIELSQFLRIFLPTHIESINVKVQTVSDYQSKNGSLGWGGGGGLSIMLELVTFTCNSE